jgi:hypothetical protein
MLAVAEREQLPVPQARAGEPAAWDTLFKRYQLPLYVYVFELVHDEQTSLDVVQETFIAAARHIASLRDDERFGSWLFGIAHRGVFNAGDERIVKPTRSKKSPGRRLSLEMIRVICSSAANRRPGS